MYKRKHKTVNKNTNLPIASIHSAFLSCVPDHDLGKITEIAKRLQELSILEENGQTNYTGADLNIIDGIMDRIADETLTQEDIFEIEKLAFKFL